MKRLSLYLIALGFFMGIATTSKGELPNDSAVILTKLKDYEREERKAVDELLAIKRDQMNSLLAEHIQRETRSGNVSRAVDIKNAMDGTPDKDIPTAWISECVTPGIGNRFMWFFWPGKDTGKMKVWFDGAAKTFQFVNDGETLRLFPEDRKELIETEEFLLAERIPFSLKATITNMHIKVSVIATGHEGLKDGKFEAPAEVDGFRSLPRDSAELLNKFKRYESTVRAELEERITTKIEQVKSVMIQHLDRESEAGNLDQMLALQAAIQGGVSDTEYSIWVGGCVTPGNRNNFTTFKWPKNKTGRFPVWFDGSVGNWFYENDGLIITMWGEKNKARTAENAYVIERIPFTNRATITNVTRGITVEAIGLLANSNPESRE